MLSFMTTLAVAAAGYFACLWLTERNHRRMER